MNTRTRQTLASILAAAAVTFGAPLLTSAQEAGAQHQAQIRAMRELDARGLADAKRCRLTLAGLGMGAQLDQARSERRDDAMLKAA